MIANGIDVDFERIRPILQLIARSMGFVRQLARLANDAESGPEFLSQGRTDDESPGLDAQDGIDLLRPIPLRQNVDGPSEQPAIAQKRRYIFENDARFWEIGNVANDLADGGDIVHHVRELT